MTIYDFIIKDIEDNDYSLSLLKGKILLIVNTATGCGFTPQYKGLQKLYDTYKDKDLEILDFPCNQFLNQAPGNEKEINNFCTLKYNTTFKRFSKINVNGKNESSLFTYLKCQAKGFLGTKRIKWNFTKFLIDKEGKILKRYSPTINMEIIETDIIKLLP